MLFKTGRTGYTGQKLTTAGTMRTSVSALLISTLVLTGCGSVRDSSLNPFNWFGGSSSEAPAPQVENDNPLIPENTGLFARSRERAAIYTGEPIDTISNLVIERVPGGAIIRATGIASVQGVYDVRLTPALDDEQSEDGVLSYRLEGIRPDEISQTGRPATREVTAARKVTDQTLSGVRSIRVEGVTNAQVSRR